MEVIGVVGWLAAILGGGIVLSSLLVWRICGMIYGLGYRRGRGRTASEVADACLESAKAMNRVPYGATAVRDEDDWFAE